MLKKWLTETNKLFFSKEPDWHWGLFTFLFSVITIRHVYNTDLSILYHQLYYPLPLFEFFHIPPPHEAKKFIEKFTLSFSLETFFIGQKIICIVSLLFCALGLGIQKFWLGFSLSSFFIFQGYLYGFVRTENDPYVHHSANIVVFILLTWLISPANQRWTALFWIKKLSRSPVLKALQISAAYTYPKWPRLLIVLTMGIVYFGSFYCKLMTSGFQWINGYTLQSILLEQSQLEPHSHAYWLASQNFFIIWLLNVSVWVFQSTAPIGFLLQKSRLIYGILGGFSTQEFFCSWDLPSRPFNIFLLFLFQNCFSFIIK